MTRSFQQLPMPLVGVGVGGSVAPLRPIANRCTAGNCPTVYVSEADPAQPANAVVQGYVVTAEQAGIDLPDGEVLVRVPLALLTEAVNNLPLRQDDPDSTKGA
jgi:hypothetical protein